MLYGEILRLKKFLIPKKIHDACNEDQNDMFISSHSQKYIFLIEFCADDEVCMYACTKSSCHLILNFLIKVSSRKTLTYM